METMTLDKIDLSTLKIASLGYGNMQKGIMEKLFATKGMHIIYRIDLGCNAINYFGKAGKNDEKMDMVDQVLELKTDNPDLISRISYTVGNAYMSEKNYKTAIVFFKKGALTGVYFSWHCVSLWIDCLVKLGQYDLLDSQCVPAINKLEEKYKIRFMEKISRREK